MSPLSAVLITQDAESHLDRVLRSLASCAEIIVLDSGSRDCTRAIASAHGARWFEHPFDTYGAQKNRATALANCDWILSVDGDEVLDATAARAIAEIDWSTADPRHCWQILRRPFVGGTEVRHGHWVPDRLVRIFNRREHGFSDHPVHPTVIATAQVRTLDGSIEHYCYADMAAVFRTDYHRLKALYYRRQGRRAGGPTLAVRGCWAFVYSYLIRRGFLDGRLGVITATAGAVNAVLGLAMASEPEERLDLPE